MKNYHVITRVLQHFYQFEAFTTFLFVTENARNLHSSEVVGAEERVGGACPTCSGDSSEEL